MKKKILDTLRLRHNLGERPKPINDWAEKEARTLIAEEFRRSGCPSLAKQYEYEPTFTTAPLRALAKYIRENKHLV